MSTTAEVLIDKQQVRHFKQFVNDDDGNQLRDWIDAMLVIYKGVESIRIQIYES